MWFRPTFFSETQKVSPFLTHLFKVIYSTLRQPNFNLYVFTFRTTLHSFHWNFWCIHMK